MSMNEFFIDPFINLGYTGMFVSAFLAATILPLGSEIILTSLILNSFDATCLVILASIGNVLGSCLNYALGYWFICQGVPSTWIKVSEDEINKAQLRLQKYGLVSLCFAWLPIIGDPITVAAGMLRVKLLWFIILVTIGKSARYIALTYVITMP